MLKDKLFLYLHRKKWRKLNTHNTSIAANIFNFDCVNVGRYTYGRIKAYTCDVSTKLNIGNFCSIGPEVSFIVSSEHYLNHISSYPFKTNISCDECESLSKGDIVVDDDVWIGYGAIILSGVHIGQGAIIAAGAVVTKDVPPYAIVGGNPARVIRYRFGEELIKELCKVDFGKMTEKMVKEHIEELYMELKDAEQLKWMPKKI